MAETRLIQGRYQLLDIIGRGGMGEVWRARDTSLGRLVAVKCLKPIGPQHDASYARVLRERFRREAQVAASLQHRGVTVVHDFGDDEGVLYLVMELLEGRNLSQLLDDSQPDPLPVADTVDIAEQVSAALAYTHRQGIVHRDLKPANIMRLTDGTVKICDFGIARLGHDIGFTSRLTGTGIAMGTPHYMSPEQIAGGLVDHRSDLYSLGCVLYELCTGAPPFDHEDAWAVLVGHRDTPPEPPRQYRPELPTPFADVVLDLLAKDPDQRPDDAATLATRIARSRPGATPAAARTTGGDRTPRPARATATPGGEPTTPATPGGEPTTPATPGGEPTTPATPGPEGEPDLPPWARHMTTGSKATGNAPVQPPVDRSAGLTGAWTGPFAPSPETAPGPEADAKRPTPPPGVLDRLAIRHHAGLSFARLGRWEEAGEVHRAVAAERAGALGPDHPDTLASRYEIAFTLGRLGRQAEALREYERVADGRERVLGPDHPDTLAARQETAYVLSQLGRHQEAHEVYRAVLAARERVMGPDHPDTLRCRHNLAFNLSRLGRLDESYRTAHEVATARARVLGALHPDTLVTRYEVAYALGQLGRREEALRTYREVAAAREQALGPDHPDTLAARYEVGISLGRLGRSEEALALYRELAADRARVHGAADPETLRARHGLGVNLGRLGRWEEALAEAREVCAIRERVLGQDHPDTLVSRREVAVCLGWLDRWPDALTVYHQVAGDRARVLGDDHPDTLASRNDEAQCLERLGRDEEAVAVYRQAAALHRVHAPRDD